MAVGFVVLEVLLKSAPHFKAPVALQFAPKGRIMTLTAALNELRSHRNRLQTQLEQIETAIASLSTLNGSAGGFRAKGKISAAGRARIAAAQRKRWARFKSKK